MRRVLKRQFNRKAWLCCEDNLMLDQRCIVIFIKLTKRTLFVRTNRMRFRWPRFWWTLKSTANARVCELVCRGMKPKKIKMMQCLSLIHKENQVGKKEPRCWLETFHRKSLVCYYSYECYNQRVLFLLLKNRFLTANCGSAGRQLNTINTNLRIRLVKSHPINPCARPALPEWGGRARTCNDDIF